MLIEKEIPCTYCQFPNSVEIWSIVNVKEDPELKDLLLGGELNMAECTSCKKIFYAESFMLYHDPDAEMLAFVYPFGNRNERESFEEKTQQDFTALKASSPNAASFTYAPLTFFGLDELVRLIEDEDEMEIQSEIVKAIAPKLKIPVADLRPSVARQQKVPRVVPGFSSSDRFNREQLLSALQRIEDENNRLSVYTRWLQTTAENPRYEIQFD